MNSPADRMSPEQRFQTAQTAHREGRLADAERHYRVLLESHGTEPAILMPFGLLCAGQGRYAEAADLLAKAVAAVPNDPALRSTLGAVLHYLNRNAEAVPHLRQAIRLRPDFAEAYANLGSVLIALDSHEEAYEAHSKALSLNPRLAGISLQMGYLCLAHKRTEEAAYWYEKAVAEQPGSAVAYAGLGNALSAVGRVGEAQKVLEKAIALDPSNAAAQFALGSAKLQMGSLAEARRFMEQAVSLAPAFPAYHHALANIAPFAENDRRLPALEAMLRQPMPDDQRVELHFALAKAYGDLKRHAAAFEQWTAGNVVKRRLVDYDEATELAGLCALAQTFTSQLFAAKSGAGYPSQLPVFVVGMPRSGTTLVEQILASHPDVFGAGEPMFLFDLIGGGFAGKDFPSGIGMLSNEDLGKLGAAYVSRLGALAPGAKRIVDKLPANFRLVGLIRLALPQARIVHVHRDPADTCVSCFGTLFAGDLNYTYDLGELGRYYRGYEDLMAHWRRVLPESSMLDVQYESLVENLESQARRLVDFCGLAWDHRCLDFHKTARVVHTASASQVRQPAYATSIGRWRRYEEQLQPLLAALARDTKSPPPL